MHCYHNYIHARLRHENESTQTQHIRRHHIDKGALGLDFYLCIIQAWKWIDKHFSHPTTSHKHRSISIRLLFMHHLGMEMNRNTLVTSYNITSIQRHYYHTCYHVLMRYEDESIHISHIKRNHIYKEAMRKYLRWCISHTRKWIETHLSNHTILHQRRSIAITFVFRYSWNTKIYRHTLLK